MSNNNGQLTIIGQVREVMTHHPDATLDDVKELVELPPGTKPISIETTYSSFRIENWLSKPKRKKPKHRRPSKMMMRTACRLLVQVGSLAEAIKVLETVATVTEFYEQTKIKEKPLDQTC